MENQSKRHIVIVGGGFGGLYTAKVLARKSSVKVTLIDRRNFHLFQPLLYQVATGGLSPGDIASPLRAIFKKYPNVRVLKAQVTDVLADERKVLFDGGELSYDALIVATGVRHHYFGQDHWEKDAPGLKTVENALVIRQRILRAFEKAELAKDPKERAAWLRFVIVGAGPTGVELAGALAELAHSTMKNEFRHYRSEQAEILLVEGENQVLPTYTASLAQKAEHSLEKLGVTPCLGTHVTAIDGNNLTLTPKEGEPRQVKAETVLWAAGVKASKLGRILAERTGAEQDRAGRIHVTRHLNLEKYPEIYVIGDLAHCPDGEGGVLPGVAPVAMQQGRYLAKLLASPRKPVNQKPFNYRNKGSLAVIGRNAAVAQLPIGKLWGWPAWMIWALIHINYLIGFGNKFLVGFQWFWNYITRKRGARLITEEDMVEL